MQHMSEDVPSEWQILEFLNEALQWTKVFQQVRSSEPFLMARCPRILRDDVYRVKSKAELVDEYRVAVHNVLRFLNTLVVSEFPPVGVERYADIWQEWSVLLDELAGVASGGALALVMQLGRHDLDAVMHAYWHRVYLAGQPLEEHAYGHDLVAKYIEKHMVLLHTGHPLYAPYY